jgi:hypothetical protein
MERIASEAAGERTRGFVQFVGASPSGCCRCGQEPRDSGINISEIRMNGFNGHQRMRALVGGITPNEAMTRFALVGFDSFHERDS